MNLLLAVVCIVLAVLIFVGVFLIPVSIFEGVMLLLAAYLLMGSPGPNWPWKTG